MRKLVETTFVTLDGVISDTVLSTAPHASPEQWGATYWDDEYLKYARDLTYCLVTRGMRRRGGGA